MTPGSLELGSIRLPYQPLMGQVARHIAKWTAVSTGYAYLVAILSVHLGTFPALHGDEAWFGLFALRVHEAGLFTLSGMNWYTGSLYGWLLALFFSLAVPDVGSLRLPGVIANAGALLLLTVHFCRRGGAMRALLWLGLWGATPLLVVKPRVAWEVYALQPLLLASLVVLLHGLIESPRRSFWRALAFLAVTQLGLLNHIIFIAVPVSLGVLLSALLIRDGDWPLLSPWRLVATSLAMSAVLITTKFLLTDNLWLAHRQVILGLFSLALVLGTAASGSRRFDRQLTRLVEAVAASTRSRRVAGRLLAAGVGLFAILHGVALADVGSGMAVFERVMSWPPPWPLAILIYGSFAAMFVVVAGRAREAWADSSGFSRGERVLALWPIAYVATFTAIRPVAPVRHYALLLILLIASAVNAIPWLSHGGKRIVVTLTLATLATTHLILWREILHPMTRRPLAVRVGWTHDTSKHFLPLEPLYQAVQANHACDEVSPEAFLRQCLEFYVATHSLRCDPSKTLEVDYCLDCPQAPYLQWRVSSK